jgi:hypothetical protein
VAIWPRKPPEIEKVGIGQWQTVETGKRSSGICGLVMIGAGGISRSEKGFRGIMQ